MVIYILVFLAGLLVGGIPVMLIRRRTVGTLRVDHSDPSEAPYLFLELKSGGMEVIRRRKRVAFNVDLNNYLPR